MRGVYDGDLGVTGPVASLRQARRQIAPAAHISYVPHESKASVAWHRRASKVTIAPRPVRVEGNDISVGPRVSEANVALTALAHGRQALG